LLERPSKWAREAAAADCILVRVVRAAALQVV
jgi:hypothetical protein